MKKIRLILVSAVFLTFAGCGSDKSKPVAVVNGDEITAERFEERYAKYLASTSSRDNILLRKRVLDNMINEVLIFDDIRRQGLDTDQISRRRMEEIRTQAFLDRYSRKISVDTVSVSEQELWREFRAYNSRVSARYLYSTTEEGARELRRKLDRGATFEALAKDVFEDPGLAGSGGYLGYFGWGDMEPSLEEAAFTSPIGTISDPVRIAIGYAIIKVEDRVEKPLASEYDYAVAKEKLSRAITDRKVIRLINNAVYTIGSELLPQFNEDAVEEIRRNWSALVSQQNIAALIEQPDAVLRESITQPFVRFRDGTWTVEDFLAKLDKTTERQRKRVKTVKDVKDVCIGLAAREILIQRAKEVGLEHDPEVHAQINHVREEYLLRRWMNSVKETVGRHGWDERELRSHYEKHRAEYAFEPELNVAEILVRTEAEARALFKRVKRGESFDTLAREYSIRTWAAGRGGELGFAPKSKYGILAEKFLAAAIGQMIGPEHVDPYYGIFRILGRREGRQKTFAQAREQIIEELKFTKEQEVIPRAIAALRKNARISVDDELLANIKLP